MSPIASRLVRPERMWSAIDSPISEAMSMSTYLYRPCLPPVSTFSNRMSSFISVSMACSYPTMYTGYPNVDRSTTHSATSSDSTKPSASSSFAQRRPSSSGSAVQMASPTSQVMSQSSTVSSGAQTSEPP